ncbi:isocitrate lyase/phosphoenolpyruvate mutase family protein [Leifsonia shinshuensis]|uniref:Phosphoenolpyruvate phosphomutase n=1 Tax=Leifsonia shinshuensis TaxID=150026 RepID=A0A7G6YAU9_9MICO|nr:isocitrate lyase/phosphoenolpyruvate mutase family protein [Leifsonia shinshuensis]QNE35614.1 phosphoenolpyruvate phosphomutase [Leifsonia shinshuensis]
MSKAAQLRALLDGDGPVLAAGAHNGIGAALARRAGYDAVWASGLEISAAHGLPDIGLLGMSDFLQAARTMDNASSLPVIADCDTGFGGEANVAYAVSSYEAAGIAAVCFEDKVFPKRNSFAEERHQELVTIGEFSRKIRAAKGAQSSPDLVIIARTEALIAGAGMDEALRRADAFAAAGADVILIHSKAKEKTQIEEFLDRWSGGLPVAIVPTTYPDWTVADAYEAGASLIIHANQGLRATVTAVQATFETMIAAGCPRPVESRIATVADIFELQNMEYWLELGA